jgi:cytidine deaminase
MSEETFPSGLAEAALEAREQAYAPYSGYLVGAAVLDVDGRVWTGCNIENVSFGLTLCAERVAVAKMVSAGSRRLIEIAVATVDGGTPCGMCLQTLAEFAPEPGDVRVWTVSPGGKARQYLLAELLPFGFASDAVERTERPRL